MKRGFKIGNRFMKDMSFRVGRHRLFPHEIFRCREIPRSGREKSVKSDNCNPLAMERSGPLCGIFSPGRAG